LSGRRKRVPDGAALMPGRSNGLFGSSPLQLRDLTAQLSRKALR